MESEAHQKPSLKGFHAEPAVTSRAPLWAADAEEPEQWVPNSPDARKRRGIGGDQLGGSRQGSGIDEAEPLLPQRLPSDAGVPLEGGDRLRQGNRSAGERCGAR